MGELAGILNKEHERVAKDLPPAEEPRAETLDEVFQASTAPEPVRAFSQNQLRYLASPDRAKSVRETAETYGMEYGLSQMIHDAVPLSPEGPPDTEAMQREIQQQRMTTFFNDPINHVANLTSDWWHTSGGAGMHVAGAMTQTLANVGKRDLVRPFLMSPDVELPTELTQKEKDLVASMNNAAKMLFDDAEAESRRAQKAGGLSGYLNRTLWNTIPFMAGVAASGVALGPEAAFGMSASIMYGERYRKSLDEGASEEAAQLEALVYGGVGAAIEMMQLSGWLKFATGANQKRIMREFTEAIGERAMKKIFASGGKLSVAAIIQGSQEGAEEIAQEWLDMGVARIGHGQKLQPGEFWRRTKAAGAGGFTAGLILPAGPMILSGIAEGPGVSPASQAFVDLIQRRAIDMEALERTMPPERFAALQEEIEDAQREREAKPVHEDVGKRERPGVATETREEAGAVERGEGVREGRPEEIMRPEFAPDKLAPVDEKGQPGLSVEETTGELMDTERAIVYRDDDGKAIGTIKFFVQKDGTLEEGVFEDTGEAMNAVEVFVSPEFRRTGIATEMWQYAKQQGYDFNELKGQLFTEAGEAFARTVGALTEAVTPAEARVAPEITEESAKADPLGTAAQILSGEDVVVAFTEQVRTLADDANALIAEGKLKPEDRAQWVKDQLIEHGLSEDAVPEMMLIPGRTKFDPELRKLVAEISTAPSAEAGVDTVIEEVVETRLRTMHPEAKSANLEDVQELTDARQEVVEQTGDKRYDNDKSNLEWWSDFAKDFALAGSDQRSRLLRGLAAKHPRLAKLAESMRQMYTELLKAAKRMRGYLKEGKIPAKAQEIATKALGKPKEKAKPESLQSVGFTPKFSEETKQIRFREFPDDPSLKYANTSNATQSDQDFIGIVSPDGNKVVAMGESIGHQQLLEKGSTADVYRAGGVTISSSFFRREEEAPPLRTLSLRIAEPLTAKQKTFLSKIVADSAIPYEAVYVDIPISAAGFAVGYTSIRPVGKGWLQQVDNFVDDEMAQAQTRQLRPRQFLESLKKADLLGDEVKDMYTVRDTEALAIKAANYVRENPVDAKGQALGRSDDVGVALAIEWQKRQNGLVANADTVEDKNRLYEEMSDFAHTMAVRLTEAGRAVQAASIVSRQTPEGMLRFAVKEINKHNRKVKHPWERIPNLTGEQVEHITREAQRIQGMPDGRDKGAEMAKLNDYIAALVPTPLMDKLHTFWKAGLLTGIPTHGLNVLSTLINGVSEGVIDVVGAPLDIAVSLLTGKRTVVPTTKGAVAGLKEGADKGFFFWKTGFDERNLMAKYDMKKMSNGDGKFAKWITSYENLIFKTLGMEDQLFFYSAKARSLFSQALAEAKNRGLKGDEKQAFVEDVIAHPTDQMVAYAYNDAEIAVFQNKTKLGDLMSLLARTPGVRWVVPFGRTPSAVAMQAINYSPAGAIKPLYEAALAAWHGGVGFDQRTFVRQVSRAAVGTGLMWLGGQLLKMGLMTLSSPEDERERELWKQEGRKPNSIKFGDKWRSALVFGPQGVTMIAGGHLMKAYEKRGTPTGGAEAWSEAAFGIMKSQVEQTAMRGLNLASNALMQPERAGGYWLQQMAGSWVPTIVSHIAAVTDDKSRRAESVKQAIQRRVPGWRNLLEPQINVFGGALPRYGGNALEAMIDPTRPMKVVKDDIVVNEIRRLWDAGYLKAMPTKLGGRYGYDVLTPAQNTELWKRAGNVTYQTLYDDIQSDMWPMGEDAAKQKRINDVADDAKDYARAELAVRILEDIPPAKHQKTLEEWHKASFVTYTVADIMVELGYAIPSK